MTSCPPLQRWRQMLAGETDATAMGLLEDHLQACLVCEETLMRLTAHELPHQSDRSIHTDEESAFLDRIKQLPIPATSEAPAERELPRVPGYEIVEEIARGGMGVVYKARHVKLNRLVALKMVLAGNHASQSEFKRFLVEAEAVAALQHPGIVQIFETSEHNGLPYFSLEFVDGGSLAAKVRDKTLSPREAATIVEQLARTMSYAHSQGVVHRDLKPENVLLALNGTPKISDFGLAKRVESVRDLTFPGAVIGTPSYMAPEQARGQSNAVGPPADIYALGAILYRLTTGRPPFQAADVPETLRQVAQDEPVLPTRLQPNIPRDLETICLKCLDKSPANRYGTAVELADDLRRFLDDQPILARPAGPILRLYKWVRRRPTQAALATVSMAALLTVLAVWAGFTNTLSRRNEDIRQERDNAQTKEFQANADRVDALVATSARLLDEDDLTGALPWLVRALAKEQRGAAMEEMHRRRIGEVMARVPRLVRLWQQDVNGYCLEFSPDGKRVAVGGQDGITHVYDLLTGKLAFPPLRQKAMILGLMFSPNGRWLATASADYTACLWNADTGQPAHAPLEHEFVVFQVAFSDDGRRMLTLTHNQARVFDTLSGKQLRSFEHGPLIRAALSPDGRRVVTGGHDHTARVWDVESGTQILPSLKHGNQVFDVAISPDDKLIGTASLDYKGRIWDAATGKLIAELPHSGVVKQVLFSSDNRHVATESQDGMIAIWRAESGELIQRINLESDSAIRFAPDGQQIVAYGGGAQILDVKSGRLANAPIHLREVPTAAIDPTGRLLATASTDGTVRVFDLTSRDPPLTVRHTYQLHSVRFSADGTRLVTGGWDSTARVWDSRSGRPLLKPIVHPDGVMSACFTPDGKKLLTSCQDGIVRLYDLESGGIIEQKFVGARQCIFAALSPDGTRLVSANPDGLPCIWDPATGRPVIAALDQLRVNSATYSPDGKTIVTTGYDVVNLWDAKTGVRRVAPMEHEGVIEYAAFSPDSRLVATAGDNKSARVWEVATGTLVANLQHGSDLTGVRFTPDGARLATAGKDFTIRIWDVATGELVLPPLKHRGRVRQIAISPDGRMLASASQDRTARVWDLATGQPITPPLRHGANVVDVVFSPNGDQVATASEDFTARIWNLQVDGRPLEDLALWSDLLSGEEFHHDGRVRELDAKALSERWQTLRQKYPAEFSLPAETMKR